MAVLLGPARNDPQTAAGARRDSPAARSFDYRRIDLVLGAIAVDRGSRRNGDDGAAAAFERAPDQPVDERVLEAGERRPSRQIALSLAELFHVPADEQEAFVTFARTP